MHRIRGPRKLLTRLAWVATFAILLLVGLRGRAWALPERAPLGQTIPPLRTRTPTPPPQPTDTLAPLPTWTEVPTQPPEPPTAVPTNTVPPQPTDTAMPLPTSTAVVTQPPEPPTATSGPVVILPSDTPQPGPTATQTAPPATAVPSRSPTRTAAPKSPTPTLPPSPTATPEPVPLAFAVIVAPQAAGPRDAVQFTVQVANVGYGLAGGVQVEVLFPHDLRLQSVECPGCTIDCPQCHGGSQVGQLTIFIGELAAGDQVIALVHSTVADDAWPDQTLRTDWTLVATGLPVQTAEAEVVLPWAQLPATGGE